VDTIMGAHIANPLDAFPAVRSRDPDEAENAVISAYGARRLDLQRDCTLNVHANHWQSANVGLSYCSYGGPVEVEFPGAAFFRLQMPLRGAAQMSVDGADKLITSHQTAVISPGARLVNEFPQDYEQLVLRINADALTRKFAAIAGRSTRGRLEFEPFTPMQCLDGLRRLLLFFVGELDCAGGQMPLIAIRELEQALIVSFLCSNPHNHTALLEGRPSAVSTRQVRRAEEYIEAHWNEPITVEELARITATSARSLFHHFKQCRGQSPMNFLKQVRLEHARQMLCNATASVTEAAFACSFSNLGHFARDYAKQFGERPSVTLKRARNL